MLCRTWMLQGSHPAVPRLTSLLVRPVPAGAQGSALDACGLAATEITVLSVRTLAHKPEVLVFADFAVRCCLFAIICG